MKNLSLLAIALVCASLLYGTSSSGLALVAPTAFAATQVVAGAAAATPPSAR
jgi:hypothetical protein